MERAELEAAYDGAGSVRALARQLGITRERTRRMLTGEGITVRPVAPSPHDRPRRYGPDHPRWRCAANLPPDLAEMYDDAGSIRALARRLGVTRLTAASWLKRLGIPTRKRGWRAPRLGTAPAQE